ncbi:hypothetical protein SMWOGL2_22390 [Sporomusa malonica]
MSSLFFYFVRKNNGQMVLKALSFSWAIILD